MFTYINKGSTYLFKTICIKTFVSDVPCSFRNNSELAISFLVSICCLSVVWIAAGSTDTHFSVSHLFLALSHLTTTELLCV